MKEPSFEERLEQLRSGAVKGHSENLAALKRIISQNKGNAKLDPFTDKGYHKIFEVLFHAVKSDRSKYAKATAASSLDNISKRLSACADVFRVAVVAGVRKIRSKTVKALVDHIIQTLPSPAGGYCEPLLNDYIKSLGTILECQAHAEHLTRDEWHVIVNFCIEAISTSSNTLNGPDCRASFGHEESTSHNGSRSRAQTPGTSLSLLGTTHRPSIRSGESATVSNSRSHAEEFVLCLQHLTFVSNAPILDKAHSILEVLINLLRTSATIGRAHQAIFLSINHVLKRTITDDIALTHDTIKNLVPLIRRLWHPKSGSLGDEMLSNLILADAYLPYLFQFGDAEDCRSELQGLVEVLYGEYCKRPEEKVLQIDDLEFYHPKKIGHMQVPLSIKAFGLRPGMVRAEQSWALLYLVSNVNSILIARGSPQSEHPSIEDQTGSNKRRRLMQPLESLLQLIRLAPASEKVCALQALALTLERVTVPDSDLRVILDTLIPCLSEDNGTLSSWAMLALSCLSYQKAASAAGLKETWLQVWRISSRNVTSSVACRAACHVMGIALDTGLVDFADISELVEGMISSAATNGPAVFADSSVTLWSLFISLKGRENHGTIHNVIERVLRWLFMKWSPANFQGWLHGFRLAHHCQAHDVVRLLASCLGLTIGSQESPSYLVLGTLSQARLRCQKYRVLVSYLTMAEDSLSAAVTSERPSTIYSQATIIPDLRFQFLSASLIDHLIAETTMLLRDGSPTSLSASNIINPEIVRVLTCLCIVSYAVSSCQTIRDTGKIDLLRTSTAKLRKLLVDCIERVESPKDRQSLIDALLVSIGTSLGQLDRIDEESSLFHAGAIAMVESFPLDFWEQISLTDGQSIDLEYDLLDIDEQFESQGSRTRVNKAAADVSHNEIAASTDIAAFRHSTLARICYVATRSAEAGGSDSVPSSFVAYLTSLRPSDLLSCRNILKDIVGPSLRISRVDAGLLMEHLAKELIESYDFERCEVALGVCLDVMTGLADMWTTADACVLGDYGASMYEWFIKIASSKGVASPHVHICISSMLQRVIKVRPDYAKSLSLPSARTSLFSVLEEGNIAVKYHVGRNISEIFGLFVLREHDAILEDVINSLPSERDWSEGIALRLLALAYLAAAWSTLLRRCVYAMFETPGHIHEATGYAKQCLDFVSTSLGLSNSQQLFRLFASQIVYTWLETQDVRSMPYAIFGYNDLAHLLRDIQDEVVGQVVMRCHETEATQLEEDLGQPLERLLDTSFGVAAAYSIARDVAIPPSQEGNIPGANTRVRKLLGKDRYTALLTTKFPDVLVVFFKTMDQEEHIARGFQKHPACAMAYKAYQRIVSAGVSTTVLPANQQPSFRAGFVFDEIEFLCSRTSYDTDSLWSPALYVYVLRRLLDTIHPALGSLHACSVLRRIRILTCMAGTTALEDYPLEMALHALRPFLTDIQCADDAIGLVQYLLEYGKPYLTSAPSFIAGVAVSILASMRAFLSSTQESTTQESHFRATMTKARAFHSWFGTFLDCYTSPQMTGASEQSFKAIMKASLHIRTNGNARKGTYESDLLMEILEDSRSGRNLLNQPAQDLILGLLCAAFEVPSDFHDDIVGEDQQAATFAPVVWETCQRQMYSQSYLLWTARVLGRAYASTGQMVGEMVREIPSQLVANTQMENDSMKYGSSRSAILRILRDALLTGDRTHVGVAERALQLVVSKAQGSELLVEVGEVLPASLVKALVWEPYNCPLSLWNVSQQYNLQESVGFDVDIPALLWIQRVCIALTSGTTDDPLLGGLPQLLATVTDLSERAFPYILHLVLLREAEGIRTARRIVSEACHTWFKACDETTAPHVKILLNAVLYLRSQSIPNESSKADRDRWLELDYTQAGAAAAKCSMFKTALLFVEISSSETARASRRSSAVKIDVPTDLLLHLFQNIDDPDSFYGVQQPSSLSTMMNRLAYENAGFKSLSFRGAHYDSEMRYLKRADKSDEKGLLRVLDTLDLNGLSHSLLSNQLMADSGLDATDAMLRTARKLEQWDISVPMIPPTYAGTIFRAFQSLNSTSELPIILASINDGFLSLVRQLLDGRSIRSSVHANLGALAVLTEIDSVLASTTSEQLEETWIGLESRNPWMYTESFDRVSTIFSCRETLFSSISRSKNLQGILRVSPHEARVIETRALLASSKVSRHHGALQSSLATATYLARLVEPCKEVGLDIMAGSKCEEANVLWDQGEMTASIRMLQDLEHSIGLSGQAIQVGKPELLAKLGHQMSEARLEKPDEIIRNYLVPAIKELKGSTEGDQAGEVFHEFASFCDKQLQNADNLEDFRRIEKLRERKEAEVRDLEKMIKSASSQAREKDNLKSHRAKAKQWFDLDDREFQRLRDSRQAFLRQSLENYLLCLKACDTYDKDALRFSALWLEHYKSEVANTAVAKNIGRVGSRKFASLMNQWSSRLLDDTSSFQSLLSSLVLRICVEHPYHGMYQVFAGSKTKGGKDETALSRNAAASNIVNQLKSNKRASQTWLAVHNTNINYVRFAIEKLDDTNIRPGSKVPLRKSAAGQKLDHDATTHRVPPPTMKLDLRADCDYSSVPLITKFQPEFTVASGISMPKILTAFASDGLKYKQLFKGGNDDLRQDAIMEQVFEQVSNLLQAQRDTRQRKLGIRTYKVLPLTATSGIIEFVPDTIPLHDYLMPAHLKHFPKDMKPSVCRKHIADAQPKPVDIRIRTFRQVTDHFRPVLRYFFMERFENPDDWFARRLAYTRSTAAISILGYVLGLGDRHGHNILLDEKTGEVVHIDLGIAFEQGRVLPVPEVVPFRLTRDLVDGMGITKTEGVFRRCCEFTLEALRNESYSIMTILDVLRYDPLYSWSLSPLRLKKLQDAQTEAPPSPTSVDDDQVADRKKKDGEPGEADRALTVVAKKLSKTLSVTATVNELIHQATDERNLAVLFAGWAAYA